MGGTGQQGPTGPINNGPAISISWGGSAYSLGVSGSRFTQVKFDVLEQAPGPTGHYDFVNSIWKPCGTANDVTWLGYYQVDARIQTASSVNNLMLAVFKNDVAYKYGHAMTANNATISVMVPILSATDTIKIFAFNGGASTVNVLTGSANTWITGSRVRGA